MHYSILSILISLTIGALLMSFQLPQDKNALQKRIESLKSAENLDSFIYYQDLLVEILEKEDDREGIEIVGQEFLEVILNSTTLIPLQKWKLLEKTTTSKAWDYAYKTQFYLENTTKREIDSAYFYLSLLENIPQNKSALIHAYGIWAKDAIIYFEDFRMGTDYLKKAEELLVSKADSVQLYSDQVVVYAAIGDFEKALINAQKMLSIQLQKSYKDSIKIAFIYDQLGAIYYEQANYDQAKNYYVEAINFIAERSTYKRKQAEIWYQLASCYFNLKNHPLETILYLRKVFSLILTNNIKNKRAASAIYLDACNMMALEFLEEKQLDSAQIYAQKAEAMALGYRKRDTWSIKGQISLQKKKFKEAETALKQGVGLSNKTSQAKSTEMATHWVILGDCYQVQKKYDQAQKVYTNALWALSRATKGKNFPVINSLFSKEQALDILTKKVAAMLALYERSKYSVSLIEIYDYAQYNLEIFQFLSATIDLSSDFSERVVVVYEQLIEVCELLHKRTKKNQYVEEAFHLAEACKTTLLQMMLEEPNEKRFGNVPTSIIQYIQTLQQRILWCHQRYWEAQVLEKKGSLLNWYQQQMANLQVSLTLEKQKLQKKYAKYYQFKYDTKIVHLDSLQQALNDTTTLVQYIEGKKSIYQFIIRKDTLAVRKIFWRTYKSTILKYYNHFTHNKLKQHLQSGGYKDFCITAYELYYKLMHHELLSNSKRIVIIPDGLLHYIPFGTLLTEVPIEKVHTINFPSLAYLLKEKQIAYNYSSTLWWSDIKKIKNPINNKILGMVATYTDEKIAPSRTQKLQRLRTSLASREEVRVEIDSLSKKYAGDFYTDRYATEYYLKDYASSYGILHIGVYGVVDPVFPEYSSLIFAEDANEEEDNVLTTNEIKQLKLNAAMVVLSNCQTGYGPYQRGEGIVNLGRSFMYAGSPSIILSLWEQDAARSSIIVNYFYESLKKNVDKDIALRQAKLKYLKHSKGLNAHPAYWAGYVAIGNYQAIEVSEPVTYIWWFVIPIAFLGFLGWWSLQALRQRR